MYPVVIFDFDLKSNLQNWKIVNDSVMGGISKSKFYLNSAERELLKVRFR
jgi:hypothetical protein